MPDIQVLAQGAPGWLQRLAERGDTVLVIEHHLDVIKGADLVIEMGPEAECA